jgi:hypothetical protein
VWDTSEGPVVITQRGKLVFVAESFDLPTARKLAELVLNSQAEGPLQNAYLGVPSGTMTQFSIPSARSSLTGPMVRFMSHCGVTKAVVDAAISSAQRLSN